MGWQSLHLKCKSGLLPVRSDPIKQTTKRLPASISYRKPCRLPNLLGNNEIDEVHRVFSKIPSPYDHLYAMMIDGYSRLDRTRLFDFSMVADRRRGLLEFHAQNVFDEMPERNVISWNVIIHGLAQVRRSDTAEKLFWGMPQRTTLHATPIRHVCLCIYGMCQCVGFRTGNSASCPSFKSEPSFRCVGFHFFLALYANCKQIVNPCMLFYENRDRNLVRLHHYHENDHEQTKKYVSK